MVSRFRSSWLVVGAVVASALLGNGSWAQEKAKEKKKSSAALPDYVGQVLTADQEKQARIIAERYEPELDKLREEIRAYEAVVTKARETREKFLDDILTASQKVAIKAFDAKMKAEADKVTDDVKLLEMELGDLRASRDVEIEGLLTAEQKSRVKDLVARAKADREANKKAKASVKKPKATASATKE